MTSKTCTNCHIEQPLQQFYRHASKRDGRMSRCKACVKTHYATPEGNLYNRWNGMHHRCYNPTNPAYPNYGGRGITICPEWNRDNPQGFESFYQWSLASGYSRELQIDRIDNDGPYSPDNCRWATPQVNSRNQRPRGGTSAYRGVSLVKARGRWQAQITLPGGTKKHLGRFDSEQEAARAYDRAASSIYGSAAKLNYIEQEVL